MVGSASALECPGWVVFVHTEGRGYCIAGSLSELKSVGIDDSATLYAVVITWDVPGWVGSIGAEDADGTEIYDRPMLS